MFSIEFYQEEMSEEWDKFILNQSMNGTFLQTRRFIHYHKDGKFKDVSLCIRKGNELVAVVLACETREEGKKLFFAHKGSTYGGITIAKSIYRSQQINDLMELLDHFLREKGFDKIYFRMVPDIYQRENTDLLDYFLYKEKYKCINELNFYMELDQYQECVESQLTRSKRRDYRYSLKNNLEFRKLTMKEEVSEYYNVLQKNLKRLNIPSVHSLEELFDLKWNRCEKEIEFYGVYFENKMIAGSMIFLFDEKVFHTQYLSSDDAYLKMYPMDFLIVNLLKEAVSKHMKYFTFGICTEDRGRYLNFGLSKFKEGFGAKYCINRSYEKNLKD